MNKMLTVSDVADIINCSPATIYSWADSGKIPFCKINGLIRFYSEDIEKFISEKKSGKQSKITKNEVSKINLNEAVKKSIAMVKAENYNSIKGKSDLSQAEERGF